MEKRFTFGDTNDSEFNIAIATLRRIDNLLTCCAMASKSRDLDEWYNILLALSREVDYMFETKEEEDGNDLLKKELNLLDNQYINYKNSKKLNDFKDYGLFYEKLASYEKFLRKFMKDKNMLIIGDSESALF